MYVNHCPLPAAFFFFHSSNPSVFFRRPVLSLPVFVKDPVVRPAGALGCFAALSSHDARTGEHVVLVDFDVFS